MKLKDMFRGRNNVLILFEGDDPHPALEIGKYVKQRPGLGETYVMPKSSREAVEKYLEEKGIFAVVVDKLSYNTDDTNDNGDRVEPLLWGNTPMNGNVDYTLDVSDFRNLTREDIEEIGKSLEDDFQQRTWFGDLKRVIKKRYSDMKA